MFRTLHNLFARRKKSALASQMRLTRAERKQTEKWGQELVDNLNRNVLASIEEKKKNKTPD